MNKTLIYFFHSLFFICLVHQPIYAQEADTTFLKKLYDRCLDFDETKADSLDYFAGFIETTGTQLKFNKTIVLASRLRGIAQDLRGNYDKAIPFYLQSLEEAKKLNDYNYEGAAINDLAFVYVNTKQPVKAKQMYLQAARLSMKENSVSAVFNALSNLGAIYNELGQPDSALIFLKEALKYGKPFAAELNIGSVYNNTGNVYYKKKEFIKAIEYFTQNLLLQQQLNNPPEIWISYLNLADAYVELKKFDSSFLYASKALQLAKALQSKAKEADSYGILSKHYFAKNDFEQAYIYKERWYTLDTSMVNEGTNTTIAQLQERFNAVERDRQNQLLSVNIEKEKLRSRIITLLALAFCLVAMVVAVFLLQKRRANKRLQQQNDLIRRQNDKLAELNFEKNSLISIVSHDLSSPFTAIKMWSQLLDDENAVALAPDQQKAINRIKEATTKGEQLIRNILDVEKAGTNLQKLALENLDVKFIAESVITDFAPAAKGKAINLFFETNEKQVFIVSDRNLVSRILENLVSNAIKYTPHGKNIWLQLATDADAVHIKVKDEGVGIDKDELPYLFSKYSNISSKPTGGEASTGLGLSIVKRLVSELNGAISCESELGKGSVFTVILKK